MSLPSFSTQGTLFSTAALSGRLFSEEDRYRIFAQVVFPLLAGVRVKMEDCYCTDNGRIAIEPVLLLGISVLQYLEGQPDRAAVEMLQYHAGWNFALNRQLGDKLFHPTTLVNFRQRLIDHDLSALGFEAVLDGLVEAGLVARQSRQRLDSTQVFGRVSRMSRLECVRTTLRLALEEVAAATGHLARPEFWSQVWERYVESKLDYRTETGVLREKMILAGVDAAQLLDWVRGLPEPGPAKGEQVRLLDRVWKENFQFDPAGQCQPREAQPPGAVHNPHDDEAQWAAKGHGKQKKEHVGYKVQVAETVSEQVLAPGEPTRNFLTAMVTQPAIASDEAGLELVEKEQARMGLDKASPLHVDGAYLSGEKIAHSKAQGQEIIGPAQPAPKKEGRFSAELFQINVEERRAVCPAGHESTQCSRLEEEATGKVMYRFEFTTHCRDCPLRARCLGKEQPHRTLRVGQYHSSLQARRLEQKTEEFKKEMRHRNAIEGTQSELVRAHGLRRARSRGLAKMRLQNYLIGAACNIKRWIRRQLWILKQALAAEGHKAQTAVLN